MIIQKNKFTPFDIIPEKNTNTDFKSNLKKYLFHWPLFIIGLIVSIALASFFLSIYKPVYQIKAVILIKDDKKADDPRSEMLKEVGITSSSEGVENEIGILKSKTLIGQVVKDLQLWITYKKGDGLLSEDIYTESPVKLLSLKPMGNLDNKKITVVIEDGNSFLLKGPDGKLTEYPFNSSYISDFGEWKLAPTKTINKYKGAVIKIMLSDSDKTTANYQKGIDADLSNKLGTSVELSVSDKVPGRGKDVLNCLIKNYNLFSSIDKKHDTKETLDFLDQRIDSLSQGLTASEKGIESFKSSRGLTDISSQSKIDLENMQVNDANLNEVNVKLSVIEGIEKYLNSNQNSEKAPATVGITDPALSNSIEKLSLLQLQHDKLAATMPETNPDFEPINSQIRTTKSALKENVKNIKASLLATKEKLESFNSGFETSIKNIPEQERELVSIKREQSSKESLYTFLLQKREEVAVKYASTLSNSQVVDQAYTEPLNDITLLVYFVALVFGIGFPVALLYTRNSLSNRITNVKEIRNVLNRPIVGELPYQKTKNFIALKEGNTSAISEQLRALRIKLYHLHNQKESGRVTLLTSSVPGEGKSFVSINLAIALSLASKRTIILELDMRKPKIAKSFGLDSDHKGISEYLNGKATKAEIIQPLASNPNLHFIGCGSLVDSPSELLEKKELKQLISSLQNEYDDIILDSPPVHLVADATILSRISDITLYIIRQGFTDKSELDFINQLLDQDQLQNIYIILNAIERVKHGYGYKYDEEYYTNKSGNFFTPIFGDFKSRL